MVGQAGLAGLAIRLTAAAGSVHAFIDGIDNLGDKNLVTVPTQQVAATGGAAHAGHQLVAAQLGEQLLQVGQRYLLPAGYIGQTDRAGLGVNRQIQHRGYGITAFCCQSHMAAPHLSHQSVVTLCNNRVI